ncbi:ankyrin repeat-containing domain protein [Lactifluus subvellereus]|nr:ankyrin repeat-containing domain protein [Lactifluus subvellereus]
MAALWQRGFVMGTPGLLFRSPCAWQWRGRLGATSWHADEGHPTTCISRWYERSVIAVDERVRIEDKVASALLNAAAGSSTAESGGDNAAGVPSDAELDVFAAAQQGKIDYIRALIESGHAHATDKDDDNITALHWAASNGKAEVCTYLIDQGAPVNAIGGSMLATPLQWAARQGLVDIVHLLIQRGANLRLIDAQGFTCLHAATHSSSYWSLLYILCQPDIVVDERDRRERTALHWAVYQRDEISTQILLKFGADPNAADRDGLTSLHWAAFSGNKSCITQLLRAGSDIRAKTRDLRTAQDVATELQNLDTWNKVVEELGFMGDGTRVRRPLSEPNVKVIVFSVPSISLCIAFAIASVFPWYMAIVLAPGALLVMHFVVLRELLQRNSVSDRLNVSPYFAGVVFGSALWMAYIWVSRLRYDAPRKPFIHAAFVLLFVLCVVALLCAMFCDPGVCTTPSHALKLVTEDLIRRNRLTTEAFCVQCLVAKPPNTRHCSRCNKCVTHHKCIDIHASWMLNCIGAKNHIYFIISMGSLTAGVLIFDYIVWTHLLTLDDAPLPAHSCHGVLPHEACRLTPTDLFLVSVSIWSTLQLVWSAMTVVNHAGAAWNAWKRGFRNLFHTVAAVAA